MNQQPDKLFREKLEGHQRPVRASAWDKVEAVLDRKSNKGLWLKVAASLLLVAVAAYLLLANARLKSVQDKSLAIAKNKIAIPVPGSATKARVIDRVKVSNRIAKGNNSADRKERWLKSEKKEINTLKTVVMQAQSEIALPDKEDLIKEDESVEVLPVESFSSVSNEVPSVSMTTSASNKAPAITLVYTIEEVDEKYLDKKSLAEATTSDKKPSTLKKMLNKATDLTRDQHPLGELRQKKDEILALNFKKKNNVDKTDKPL